MADRKNQHYVPKLYLKLFSVNNEENQIGLYNFSNDIFRSKVGLKSQAKEDYFYGEDGYFEEQLSKLESLAAPVIKNIISTNTLPGKKIPDYFKLLTFSIIMAQRTKDVAEQIKEMTDKLWRTIMSYDERFKDKIKDLRIYPENPAGMALAAVTERLHLAMDLKLKLLINKTSLSFITSDHPVVKYNQFLEQRKHPGGNVGLATKGLQLFFPISPVHMLCFYDDWAYKIGDRTKDVLFLNDKNDIDKLNYLQALNCYDHLYFNDTISEHYIRTLVATARAKRLKTYGKLQKTYSYFDKEGQEHIGFLHSGNNLTTNLTLSFIKQTKKAKKHVLSDYAAQLRDESLRDRLKSN